MTLPGVMHVLNSTASSRQTRNQARIKAMPDLTIDSFVDDVARRSNIDPAAAETAVGTILSVIQQEGNPSKVAKLFSDLPGAADLAQKHPVVSESGGGVGGALSSLAGKFIGADAGVMVAAVAQIEQTGLTLQQIKNVGAGLVSYLQDANPTLAKEILDKVPSLREHLT
jgi:predicted transcriptional regulator with HTH domain